MMAFIQKATDAIDTLHRALGNIRWAQKQVGNISYVSRPEGSVFIYVVCIYKKKQKEETKKIQIALVLTIYYVISK